jgi:AbrB family looped-hinge helix DNA binding protein
METGQAKIADAIWTATALLHRENPAATDFSVQEIVSRAVDENLVGGFKAGLQPHASWHCVANKAPNPGRYRILFETSRGRRRLFRESDSSHPDRQGSKIHPRRQDLPQQYQPLLDWYDAIYSKQPPPEETTLPEKANTRSRHSVHDISRSSNFGNDPFASAVAFVGSAGAVVIPADLRKELGIEEGTRLGIWREHDRLILQPVTPDYIRSLRGCCKGEDSLVEAREREHRMEK